MNAPNHNQNYYDFVARHDRDFLAAGQSLTHRAYGFPITMMPGVFFAHPDFTGGPGFVIDNLPQDLHGKDVLDVGTGTGVIAIAAALRGANVLACDIDPKAVAVARYNVQQNNLNDRVEILESDLLVRIRADHPQRRFDIVVASMWLPLGDDLNSGSNFKWLDAYRRFLNAALSVMKPEGVAMLVSSSVADQAATEETFADAEITPKLLTRDNAHDGGKILIQDRLYSFTREGKPAALAL